MKLSQEQIQIIDRYLKDKPVVKAYVFGSYARGDADEKSDIDLLIQIDYKNMQGGLWYYGMPAELKERLDVNVDVVSEAAVSPYIQKFVDRDKYLIYERAA